MSTNIYSSYRLHLHNIKLGEKVTSDETYVGQSEKDAPTYVAQFGFPVTTCCGYLAQDNTWCDDWVVSL